LKEIRKELTLISVGLGVMGIFLNVIYIRDWWMPLTLSGNIPAIEDFLYAFAKGGFAMGLFCWISGKTKKAEIDYNKYGAIIGIVLGLFLVLHFFFGLNTFITTTAILVLGLMRIYYKRPETIKSSLITGALFLAASIIIYNLVEILTPGWLGFWYFENVPEIVILKMPLDDLIYYPLFGAAIGPIYEYLKLRSLNK